MIDHARKRGRFRGMSDEDARTVVDETIDRAIANGDVRELDYGRTGYFDQYSGRLCIDNPTPGKSSTYIPKEGFEYFIDME